MSVKIFFLFSILFFCFDVSGQADSVVDEISNFKKIKKFIIRKVDADSSEITKMEINDSSDLNLGLTQIEYKVLPKLSSDKKGFLALDIAPYEDKNRIVEQGKYIVFEFVVNEKGNVSTFLSHETNEQKLIYTLIDKIKNTVWSAAEDFSGNKVEYNFGKWILRVPENGVLRDYELERD